LNERFSGFFADEDVAISDKIKARLRRQKYVLQLVAFSSDRAHYPRAS
jgi:hypothetical protein